MTGFTDYGATNVLQYHVGKTAMPTLPTVSVGLFTVLGGDSGSGFAEVTGGNYARVTTAGSDWNTAAGSAPRFISNSAVLNYNTASADWGIIVGFGGFDAPSGGNLLWFDWMGAFSWSPVTVAVSSPSQITLPNHTFAVNDSVVFSTEFGGASPTFSQSSFTGLLVVAATFSNIFTVTNGGTAVNTSTVGNGQIRKVTPLTVNSGNQPFFGGGNPGQLVLRLA